MLINRGGAAERMFGYTAGEAVGQSVRMLIPADRRDEEDHVLAKIRAGEKIDHYETIRQHRHGTRLSISLTVSPIRNDKCEIIGASKVARDITERSRLLTAVHCRRTWRRRSQAGMEDGQEAIDAKRASLGGKSDSLFGDRAFLKNDYVARAAGTQVGIGAISREEAMYPILDKDADGQPLDGSKGRYVLRFAKGGILSASARCTARGMN